MLAMVGLGFFNTVIWAMITDVIDDAEVKKEFVKMERFTHSIPLHVSSAGLLPPA